MSGLAHAHAATHARAATDARAPMTRNDPHPLAPIKPTDDYRIEGRMAVRALARELFSAHTTVGLFADSDGRHPLVSRVVQLDGDSIGFDFDGPDDRLRAIREARTLTVVGLPGAVRIQFDVSNPAIIAGRSEDGSPADIVVCSLPSRGWRIQRRHAFRVCPPRIDRARVVIRRPDGAGELMLPLEDLSISGIGLQWPVDEPLPEPGDGYRHCRIESEAIAAIPCDLQVIRLQPGRDRQNRRISFAFYAMPQDVARFVQMYVMDVERRTRSSR